MSDADALALLASLDRRARRQRTPFAGGAVTWRCWGSPRPGTRPLLLLHGGGGSWQHWVRNIDALSATREVWAADQPGFADSDDAPAPAHAPQVAQALGEALDALFPAGPRPVLDLAGFSFGGIVGGLLAAERPGRFGRLVIVGSTALGLPRPELGLRSWRNIDDPAAREARQVGNLRALMMAHHADGDRLAVLVHSRNLERARVDGRVSAGSTWLRDAIPRIDAQLCGIWGSLDATVQPDVRDAERVLRAQHPGLRFAVIEDAGHWVQYEAADRFDATLLAMLDDSAAA